MSVYAKNQDGQQLGPWETIKNVENLEFDANGIWKIFDLSDDSVQ